jgi:hypothetical protein
MHLPKGFSVVENIYEFPPDPEERFLLWWRSDFFWPVSSRLVGETLARSLWRHWRRHNLGPFAPRSSEAA